MKSRIVALLCFAAPLLASCEMPTQWAMVDASKDSWWENAPTPDDYKNVYPTAAEANNISGQADLVCLILPDRHVDCVVESETPLSWGFGEAALVLSHDFIVKPADQDQRLKIGSRIKVPVIFKVPDW